MAPNEDQRLSEEEIISHRTLLQRIKETIHSVIVGQDQLIDRVLISLICNRHVLIEGVPGLAKTLLITTLSQTISSTFQRIQFTPDLLPADLLGTLIFNPKSGEFSTKKGPIFNQIILADEINRAPAKVQSALLEAMQERQVTIGDDSFPLDKLFLVMATQNPVEQEGTYPLPEAQVDRFMMKVLVDYPEKDHEIAILHQMSKSEPIQDVEPVATPREILDLRKAVDRIYLDPKLEEYIVNIVRATRNPGEFKLDIEELIEFGASPRASINLALAARAQALLSGRSYVTPQDIKTVGKDVLRHRIMISYEAEAEEKSADDILNIVFDSIEVP